MVRLVVAFLALPLLPGVLVGVLLVVRLVVAFLALALLPGVLGPFGDVTALGGPVNTIRRVGVAKGMGAVGVLGLGPQVGEEGTAV